MLVYKVKKSKLEEVKSIDYKGKGEEYFRNAIGLEQVQVKTIETVFADLKSKLNNVKKDFDKMSDKERKNYNKCVSVVENTSQLKGQDGRIAKEYNGEIITNAWLKMYELLSFCDSMFQLKAKKNAPLRTMHFAEAPGNFILAFNHKLSSEYPQIEWVWNANSYITDSGSIYLDDKYNLIKNYPDRWKYGAECNGDITRISNIRDFSTLEKYDVVTSDVKFAPPEMNYDEEENCNSAVQLGQVLCALATLATGGIAILKFLSIYESATQSMIALLSQHFEKVYLTKPLTSKSQNSEIYIVCVNFTTLHIQNYNRALTILDYYSTLPINSIKPSLFISLQLDFIQSLRLFSTYITEKQIASIKSTIKIFRSSDISNIILQHADQNSTFSSYWLSLYKISPLPLHKILGANT